MDPQERDDFKIRRRQESFARRLGEALDGMDARDAGDCPDGEILAAYAERGLSQVETEKWESHFATCPRCRRILLVLDASAETPLAVKEVARLGELVSTARAPVEIAGRSAGRARPKFLGWRMRWLTPALGAAAVLVVWFAMRPLWRTTAPGPSETLVAQAPKQEMPPPSAPAELDQLSRVAPQRDEKALPAVAPTPDRFSAKAPSVNSTTGADADSGPAATNAMKKVQPSAGFAGSTLQKEEKSANSPADSVASSSSPASPASAPPTSQAKLAPETPPSAPLAQASSQDKAATAPAPVVFGSTSQTVTVTEAAPRVDTTNGTLGGTAQQESSAAAELPVNGRNAQALLRLRPARGFSVLLKANSGSTLWRAGNGGLIQRSTDAGKSWFTQASPTQEAWLAGVAVSDSACWLVGRNGAIARTVDGVQWQSVLPPPVARDASGKFPDWVGITAMDAQGATVTASDGRRFATLDGGQTWQAQ